MISFDFHHLGAFFRPELSRYPPCSPSFEGAILDSKLENVGPMLSRLQKHMHEICQCSFKSFRGKKELLARYKRKFLVSKKCIDVLNRNSTPHTLEKCGGYMENYRDYLMELPSTYTGTSAAQLNHIP